MLGRKRTGSDAVQISRSKLVLIESLLLLLLLIATPCGKVGRMPGRFRRRAPAANAALGGSGCGRHVLLGSVPRGLDDDQDQVSWSALQHSGALRS